MASACKSAESRESGEPWLAPASPPLPRPALIVLAFATLYIVWGSTYLAIRIAIETLPGFTMAGVRFVCAGTLLYSWSRWRGASAPRPRQWLPATIIGGLLLLCGNGGVVWAESIVPSGLAALLVTTMPLWMTLLDWLGPAGVRPSAQTWFGLLLGFVGMVLLVGTESLAGEDFHIAGALILLVASMCWASGSIYARHVHLPPDPLLNSGMQMLAGGVLLLLAGGLMGEWATVDPRHFSSRSLLAFVYLIIFGSLAGFTAYSWLVRVTRPVWVSTYAFVNPVIAVLLGWAFLGEHLPVQALAAGAVIIVAVALIITSRAKAKPSICNTDLPCIEPE